MIWGGSSKNSRETFGILFFAYKCCNNFADDTTLVGVNVYLNPTLFPYFVQLPQISGSQTVERALLRVCELFR